jgi:hypothetical protein
MALPPFTMTMCLHALSLGERNVAQRARREQLFDPEQPVGDALKDRKFLRAI